MTLDPSAVQRNPRAIVANVLTWWDAHRRALPWRAPAGEAADPYRVWLSEILLQQTTAAGAAPYFLNFVARWPDVEALAAAPLVMACRTWKKPHAIAMSQNCTFKSLTRSRRCSASGR